MSDRVCPASCLVEARWNTAGDSGHCRHRASKRRECWFLQVGNSSSKLIVHDWQKCFVFGTDQRAVAREGHPLATPANVRKGVVHYS